MAPARMVQFIKEHVASCEICLSDPDIQNEIEKITEIILPESKIPKAVRLQQEKDDAIANQYHEKSEEEDGVSEQEGEKDTYMDDDEDINEEELDELDESKK